MVSQTDANLCYSLTLVCFHLAFTCFVLSGANFRPLTIVAVSNHWLVTFLNGNIGQAFQCFDETALFVVIFTLHFLFEHKKHISNT